MNATLGLYALGSILAAAALPRLKRRLELSRAKHRSLGGHARMSRFVARLVPFYEYGESRFYGEGLSVDGQLQFGFPYFPLSLLAAVDICALSFSSSLSRPLSPSSLASLASTSMSWAVCPPISALTSLRASSWLILFSMSSRR